MNHNALFDRLAWLAADTLAAPMAFICAITNGRLHSLAATGLPETHRGDVARVAQEIAAPALTRRTTLTVRDATRSPSLAGLPAFRELGVRGYLAAPLLHGEEFLGSICVADLVVREWSRSDHQRLDSLAALAAAALVRESSAQRLEASLDISLDAVITVDHQGIVIGFSKAAEQMFGMDRVSVMGRAMQDLIIPPETRAAHLAAFRRVVETGESLLLRQRLEVGAQRMDGTRFPAELTIDRLPLEGPPVFTAFVRDLTARLRADAALRESERRFRQLTENIHEVFWLATADGTRLLYLSPAYEQVWGRPASDLIERRTTFLETVHLEDRARVRHAQQEAADGVTYDIEYRIVRPDGTLRWVHDRAFPVRDDLGVVVRRAGIAEDITERVAGEKALRESARRLERLIANVPGVVLQIRVGTDDRIGLPFVSQAARAIFGIDAERAQCDAGAVFSRLPREDMEALRRQLIHAARDMLPIQWDGRLTVDGMMRWIEVKGKPDAQEGGDVIFDAIVLDVTERRRARFEIEYQAQLLDHVEQAVIATDLDFRVTWWNRHAERLYGYAAGEAVGRPVTELTIPMDERRNFSAWVAPVREGASRSSDVWRMRRDGSVFLASVTVAPTLDPEGGVTGFVAVSMDASERRSLEMQLRQALKMEAVGRLAGGVAHDFNNLLTVIKLHSEFLMEAAPLGSALHEDLDEIKRATARGASLTRQLLAFSRQQVLEPRELDLHVVVEDLERMLGRLIGEDVELVTRLEAPDSRILADPGQVEQVIVNLALNARDAMPHGGVLLVSTNVVVLTEAPATRAPSGGPVEAGAYVAIEVRDTGVGMDAGTRSRIFEPFFTTKPIGEGSGLGLATVYGIVEQSGGFITVESSPGFGSAFTVHFPRVQPVAAGVGASDGTAAAETGATILLVEDEPALRALARRILSHSGYTVLEASGGREALDVIAQTRGRIDALVTDAVMPEMGGLELIQRVAALCPGVRALYMSGYANDDLLKGVEARSGVAFLQKPFTGEQLTGAVRRLLGLDVT